MASDCNERLNQLERSCKRWRAVVVVLIFAWIGPLIFGQAQTPREKTATDEIIVRGKRGMIRIGVSPDGDPGVFVYDSQKKMRLALWSSDNTPTLQMLDSNGKAQVQIGPTKEGAPVIALLDGGQGRAALLLDNGLPVLQLADAKGRTGLRATVSSDGAADILVGQSEESQISIRADHKTGCKLTMTRTKKEMLGLHASLAGNAATLFDSTGKACLDLSVAPDGRGSVEVSSPDGQLRAALKVRDDGRSALFLGTKAGDPGLQCAVGDDGSLLTLARGREHERVWISTHEKLPSGFLVFDKNLKERAALICESETAVLRFKNPEDKVLSEWSAHAQGDVKFDVWGELKSRLHFGFARNSKAPSLELNDAEGKTLFKAP